MDGNKEDVKSIAKKLARKLIVDHVNDNVVVKLKSAVVKLKSAASSGRARLPPHFKSQPVNAPPPESKLLETTLQEILKSITPEKDDSVMRTSIVTQLRDLLKSQKGLEGFTVEPYGSFVSNLHTKWSDMDISVFTCTTTKPTDQAQRNQISRAMSRSGLWSNVEFVPARVPIIKGLSKLHKNTPCDVSFDNVTGVLKSNFLLWIGDIDIRFRPLVLLVKRWAKIHDINNSREGTLNSYTLCLLVIFHLQTSSPSILPPLQEIYPRNASNDMKGERTEAAKSIEKIAKANIAGLASTSNTSSISDLLLSFFEKFSDINSKATKFAVCTYTGSWVNITDNRRWCLRRRDQLFVEDPFEQPENSAKSVSQLKRIEAVFKTSLGRLRASVSDKETILDILTGKTV